MFKMKFPPPLRPVHILFMAAIICAVFFLFLLRNQSQESPRHHAPPPREHRGAEPQASTTTRPGDITAQHDITGKPTSGETARELLDRFFAENPDIDKRSKFCSDLIGKLCRSGRSSEAWSLIDPGYGNIRRSGLVGYFASSDDSTADLVAKLKGLDPKSDFQAAYTGLAFRFPVHDLAKFLTSDEFAKFSDEVKGYDMKRAISNSLSGSLQLALIRAGNQSGILTAFEAGRDLHEAGFLNQEMFLSLLTKDKTGDAFSKWGFVVGMDEDAEWGADALQSRKEIIGAMISENAGKAIELLLTDEGKRNEADINSAFSIWSSMDSGGASSWYAAHKSTLTASQLDRVASGFSNAAMESSEFESARLWAEQVTNPEAKNKLLGRISQLVNSK
jgi:hypothetical protein